MQFTIEVSDVDPMCETLAEELRQEPDRRLRLTVGLRKVEGRWLVTHEHHSLARRGRLSLRWPRGQEASATQAVPTRWKPTRS